MPNHLNNTFNMSHDRRTCKTNEAAVIYEKADALRSSRSCFNGPQPAPWPIRTIRCALDNLDAVVKEYKIKDGNQVLYIIVP